MRNLNLQDEDSDIWVYWEYSAVDKKEIRQQELRSSLLAGFKNLGLWLLGGAFFGWAIAVFGIHFPMTEISSKNGRSLYNYNFAVHDPQEFLLMRVFLGSSLGGLCGLILLIDRVRRSMSLVEEKTQTVTIGSKGMTRKGQTVDWNSPGSILSQVELESARLSFHLYDKQQHETKRYEVFVPKGQETEAQSVANHLKELQYQGQANMTTD